MAKFNDIMWFLTVAEDAVGASDAISLSSILMFAVTALVVAYVISFFVSNAKKVSHQGCPVISHS
jgi:FtsH-binding integral membrane protein